MIAKEISTKYNLLLMYDTQKEITISKIEQNGHFFSLSCKVNDIVSDASTESV